METNQNLNELLKVLEKIRSEKYPEIPSKLVEAIAIAQYENRDIRSNARTRTREIVGNYINNNIKTEE